VVFLDDYFLTLELFDRFWKIHLFSHGKGVAFSFLFLQNETVLLFSKN